MRIVRAFVELGADFIAFWRGASMDRVTASLWGDLSSRGPDQAISSSL
jgi:hypothetical protein